MTPLIQYNTVPCFEPVPCLNITSVRWIYGDVRKAVRSAKIVMWRISQVTTKPRGVSLKGDQEQLTESRTSTPQKLCKAYCLFLEGRSSSLTG